MSSPTTHSSLLDEARDGRESAWEELVQRYSPFLRRELRRVLRGVDEADVEDLCQEILHVLLVQLGRFQQRGTGAFRAFLREITRRQTLVWIDRRKRFERVRERDMEHLSRTVDQWREAQSELSRQWDREHAAYWVDCLLQEFERRCFAQKNGHRMHAIFVRVQVADEDIREVASSLDVSLATAYRDWHAALGIIQAIRRDWADWLE